MKRLDVLAAVLVVVGALNLSLVGLARFDLVASLFGMRFGETSALTSVVYALVGLAGVYQAVAFKGLQRRWLAMPAIVAMLVAVPGVASAQEEGVRGRWSVMVASGATVPAGGKFHEAGRGTVLGLPTSVDAKSNGDIFDPGIGWRAGVGYGVSRKIELFGDFGWTKASASELSVGNVASLDLRAAFADYTSYGVEGGMRLHLTPDARVAPYLTALAGFRRVEAISGTFSVPAAGVTLRDTPFFDDSVVPVFGGGAGVLFAVTSRLSLGVEAGIRYHTDLTDIEGLAGTGLENLNDAGSRWSAPISGVVRFGF